MAQIPTDQNFYHHSHSHPHSHPHPQLQLPPQFRNPFDLIFDERTGAINYNYIRPYLPNQIPKSDELSDSLVMRRPRRTRTTFTSAQIAELEQHFLQGRYLTSTRLAELSTKLALGTAQVKIWFKNRRRRHKIQSDQQKDQSFSCDGMQISPLASTTIKSEQNSVSTANNVPTLSLGSSGGSTPTTLTPSPTPTTPNQSHLDNFSEPLSSYYYNNSHPSPHSVVNHGHQPHAQQFPPCTPTAGSQYLLQSSGQHHHSVHQHQHQHQYYHHQYDFQHKSLSTHGGGLNIIKDDPDFGLNNGYYIHLASNVATSAAVNINGNPSSTLSPNSGAFEPTTPKNEEIGSLSNGIAVNKTNTDVTDEVNRTKLKALQPTIINSGANGNKNVCSSVSSMVNNNAVNLIEDCNGSLSKYNKMPTGDAHDPNYHCTIDTLMQAYNSHRNSTGNTQFAYCFN